MAQATAIVDVERPDAESKWGPCAAQAMAIVDVERHFLWQMQTSPTWSSSCLHHRKAPPLQAQIEVRQRRRASLCKCFPLSGGSCGPGCWDTGFGDPQTSTYHYWNQDRMHGCQKGPNVLFCMWRLVHWRARHRDIRDDLCKEPQQPNPHALLTKGRPALSLP
jgi:hypothetical protein